MKENKFLLFAKLQIMFQCSVISRVLLALQWLVTVPFTVRTSLPTELQERLQEKSASNNRSSESALV